MREVGKRPVFLSFLADTAKGSGRGGGGIAWAVIAVCFVAVLGTRPAAAQKSPDAGTLLREQRQSIPDLTPPPTLNTPLMPPAPHPSRKEGETVHVTDIQVKAKLFPEETLKDVVKDSIGKDATLGDLQELAARIGTFYREHGILARAYLPQQPLDNGVVIIQVIEATLGEIRIDPSSKMRLPADTVRDYLLNEQPVGETFRLDAVEDGVGNLMTVPGMNVLATVAPGAKPGQSDLVLKLDEGPLLSGTSLMDNGASRSVGTWRWVGAASLNDGLGLGEQTALTLSKSEASRLGLLRSDLPVGYGGLRAGIELAALDFQTLRRFNASQPQGGAASGAVFLSHPLWRGEDSSAEGRLSFYHKRLFSTTSPGAAISRNVIDEGVFAISGLANDELFGGGVLQFDLTVVGGNLDLSGDTDFQNNDRISSKAGGVFGRANATLSRTQPLTGSLSAVLRVSGQLAVKNLDSSEQFSLGGPDQIRAYPLGEAAGDEGVQITAELRQRLTEDLQVAAFWDGGQIVQHARPWADWAARSNAHNDYSLEGAGLGLAWHPLSWLSLDGSAAHRIGHNPGVSGNGIDADGYRERWHAWIRLAVNF